MGTCFHLPVERRSACRVTASPRSTFCGEADAIKVTDCGSSNTYTIFEDCLPHADMARRAAATRSVRRFKFIVCFLLKRDATVRAHLHQRNSAPPRAKERMRCHRSCIDNAISTSVGGQDAS